MANWFIAFDVRHNLFYIARGITAQRVGETPVYPTRSAALGWLNGLRHRYEIGAIE